MSAVAVVDVPEQTRYELRLADELAGTIDYRDRDGARVLVHTEVEVDLEGEGLGSELVRRALDDIRARDLKVVPRCSFVRAYIREHDEYGDLVARA